MASSWTLTWLKRCCGCIERALGARPFVKPRIVVCIPNRLQDVERRAIQDAARTLGAKEVFLVGKPIAAAIGAQMPIERPLGNMVIDVGGGTTEVGIISLGGVVVTRSSPGRRESLRFRDHRVDKESSQCLGGAADIGRYEAQVGSAVQRDQARRAQVTGRDLSSGIPKRLKSAVTTSQMRFTPALRKWWNVCERHSKKALPEPGSRHHRTGPRTLWWVRTVAGSGPIPAGAYRPPDCGLPKTLGEVQPSGPAYSWMTPQRSVAWLTERLA